MKKLLFGTDFSPKSQRALRYALQVFKAQQPNADLKVVLLHVDNPSPVLHPEVGAYTGMTTVIDESLKVKEAKLSSVSEEWERIYPHTTFERMVTVGPVIPKIREIAEEVHADFIVVGASGYGPIEQQILGSTAVGLSKHAPCPVFIVPDGAILSGPEKILFATDFKNLEDEHILDPLKDLVGSTGSELMLLHIYQNEDKLVGAQLDQLQEIDGYLELEKFDYYFLQDTDKLKGIEQFISGYRADILTLVAQERGFFEELFHRSLTRRLIFHSRVPILVLHPIFWGSDDDDHESFAEKVDRQVQQWRATYDGLRLQSQLGRMEASDEISRRMKEVNLKIDSARDVTRDRWGHFRKEISMALQHLKRAVKGD